MKTPLDLGLRFYRSTLAITVAFNGPSSLQPVTEIRLFRGWLKEPGGTAPLEIGSTFPFFFSRLTPAILQQAVCCWHDYELKLERTRSRGNG